MTKEVIIIIKGVQKYAGEEIVETVTEAEAEYYLRNGSHYVMFEEETEGFTAITKSMLKFRGEQVELTKKGLIQSHMLFEEGKQFVTDYRTPFGAVPMGISTKSLRMRETEQRISIEIEYTLEANEEHMADCHISIDICERR